MVTASKIAESLGGMSVMKERLADYTAVIQRAKAGLPYAALETVQDGTWCQSPAWPRSSAFPTALLRDGRKSGGSRRMSLIASCGWPA